ncbi:FAD-binding protein [Glaciecola sp. 1036]|uniref:FAD-binding protein n=1 Tax=Alteromonadaceae TaxID=72275 RepID=UPI003CFDD525
MRKLFKGLVKVTLLFIGISLLMVGALASYILIDLSPEYTAPTPIPEQVNDITQLNPIRVAQVIRPTNTDEIRQAIMSSKGKISIGGGRYSQGGQIALEDSLHIDMRSFNQVLSLDVVKREITVQSGIRWRDIQEVIDPQDLSIKIMQSYSNFTVGGSLSVNVHGRYMGEGPIIRSVKSIKMILANGEIIEASPTINSEIFYAAIGGYGGLGVITEATLKLVPNVKVARETQYMPIGNYSAFFQTQIKTNENIVFHNADIYPPNYTQINSVSWVQSEKPLTVTERLIPKQNDYWWQPKIAKFVAD